MIRAYIPYFQIKGVCQGQGRRRMGVEGQDVAWS